MARSRILDFFRKRSTRLDDALYQRHLNRMWAQERRRERKAMGLSRRQYRKRRKSYPKR